MINVYEVDHSIAKDPNVEGKNKTNLFYTIYIQIYLDFLKQGMPYSFQIHG